MSYGPWAVLNCAHRGRNAARSLPRPRAAWQGRHGGGLPALDARLDRVVALKVLQPDTASDVDRTRRFVREAKAASSLNHPNIVTVYEIGSVDAIDFIALEYVDGTPLNKVIAGRPLEPSRALEYAMQIADALAAAHAAGIVHRDLKPANIMVTRSSGRDAIKVLDFGLAKRVNAAPTEEHTLSALIRACRPTPASRWAGWKRLEAAVPRRLRSAAAPTSRPRTASAVPTRR